MGLMSFEDYRANKNESSPATRNKWAAANGLQPMYSADVFGHSTPPPFVTKELLKKIGDKPKKKSKKAVLENKSKLPDRSIDKFIDKAEKASKEIDKETKDAKKKEKDLDDKINTKKKVYDKVPTKPTTKSTPKDDIDDQDSQDWQSIFNKSLSHDDEEDDNEKEDKK